MGNPWEVNGEGEKTSLEPQIRTISATSNSTTASTREDLPLTALTEFLDLDDRPTFILDLESSLKRGLIYHNASLEAFKAHEVEVGRFIVDIFDKDSGDLKARPFLDWALTSNDTLRSIIYLDVRWSSRTIRRRWRVITGRGTTSARGDQRQSISFDPPPLPRHSTAPVKPQLSRTDSPARRTLDAQISAIRSHREEGVPSYPPLSSSPDRHVSLGRYDVTGSKLNTPVSTFAEFFANFDWASTALGPMQLWSPLLRRMCNFMMSDPRPAAIYWGKDKTTIYNEAYVLVTGDRHPFMLGKPFSESWPEVQEYFLPEFDKAVETGRSFVVDDARFYIERHGYIEETYYSIAICPFDLEDGEIGYYNPVFDTTKQIISDRRMSFLLRVGQMTAISREAKDFWQQLIRGMDVSNPDVPFALLYAASGDFDETVSIASGNNSDYQEWDLEGSIGVPEAITTRYTGFGAMKSDVELFLPNFKALIKSESPIILQLQDGSLPAFFSHDIPIMNGTQKCEAAAFLPIRSTGENVLGFLIVGINPRKRWDDNYKIFVELLNRQIGTSMASTLLLEEEVRRSRIVSEQADKDRNLFSEKIENQKQKALEIETRFRRMADLAPVGMFHYDVDGSILYANDNYYNLTDHPREVTSPMSWYDIIHEDDRCTVDREWAKLTAGENVNLEMRLKRPFVAEDFDGGEKLEGSTWIIAAAYAEKDTNNQVVGVLGCITDISRQKWAEGFQTRKMLEAVERKRQQENFIDMTSHEMRNPLSAIIQCADWISTTIRKKENLPMDLELIDSYADSAQTIILCAEHQTRIIDDILTLSKLDSDLLLITPVDSQPIRVVSTALKMFSGELKKHKIDFTFNVEQSYQDLVLDWVKMDPSRLLQVLINLTTNAIKFTQSEATRKISISLGASLDLPPPRTGMAYLPRGGNHRDMTLGEAWGTGEIVYFYIQVEDTGRGLDDVEKGLLFRRFSQSSPKTHVQYGGSGLGLFISRRLTELQGGQIGVASKAGVGSTFAFFVKTRRCDPPHSDPSAPPISVNKAAEQTQILTNRAFSQIPNTLLPNTATIATPVPAATKKSKLSTATSKILGVASPGVGRHVLVVEDNLVNQMVLVQQLRSAGYIVHVANHGAEALTFLESSQFWHSKTTTGIPLSVILMDLEMPVMDGLTCVKAIRALQAERKIVAHVPTLAVTANARSEQIKVAKAAGMDSVVTKPFRIGDLIPEIERWCGEASQETKVSA